MNFAHVRRHIALLFLLVSLIATALPTAVASAANLPSVPTTDLKQETTCASALQGRIAWDYDGHTQWNDANVQALCQGAEASAEPARCFQQVMHGGVNWGGGTRWGWQNALDLCESTPNAARTIQCFEAEIGNGQHWQNAIASCDERSRSESSAPTQNERTHNQEINRYINALNYNPQTLLRVQPPGTTSSIPVTTRTDGSNGVIVCTQTNHTLRSNVDDVAILDPNAGVIFPGALLLANQELTDGHPQSLTLARNAATFTVNLPGLSNPSFSVSAPSFSTVQGSLNRKLDEWNRTARPQGYRNAALSSLVVEEGHSTQQVALALGLSAEWLTGSNFDSMMTVNHASETETLFALYRQVFYRVTMDEPREPAALFGPSVTAQDVRTRTGDHRPPVYVRSVDYGRLLLIKMEVAKSETDSTLKANFERMLAAAQVSGSIDASYSGKFRNAHFTVAAIGGSASNAARFNGSRQDLARLGRYIQSGASYSPPNPGVPIAYTTAFLKDGRLARMGFSSDYNTQECVEHRNGFVKIRHDGAYVAHFKVTWKEPDATGQLVSKSWPRSGNRSSGKTAGYTKQVDLPGDATNVRIQAWIATGLVWQPWAKQSVSLSGPSNRCYRFGGTTLNSWYDNSCN